MSIVKEFKEFAMRGNVVDLAVGVVIGGAFGKIVSSLVENIVSPIIGIVIGGVKLDGYKWVLKHGPDGEPSVVLNYGSFVQSVVDFIIIAFVIFMVIKLMNTLKRRQEQPAAPAPAPIVPPDVQLLTEIRDLLKGNK